MRSPEAIRVLAGARQEIHGGFATTTPGPTRQELLVEERKRQANLKRARRAALRAKGTS